MFRAARRGLSEMKLLKKNFYGGATSPVNTKTKDLVLYGSNTQILEIPKRKAAVILTGSALIGFVAGLNVRGYFPFPGDVGKGSIKNDESEKKEKEGDGLYYLNTDATADMDIFSDEKYFVGVIARRENGEVVCGALNRIDNEAPLKDEQSIVAMRGMVLELITNFKKADNPMQLSNEITTMLNTVSIGLAGMESAQGLKPGSKHYQDLSDAIKCCRILG